MPKRGRHLTPRPNGRGARHFGRTVPLALAFVLAIGAVALAADLETSSELSTSVALPSEVSIGANSFNIEVTATGNVPTAHSGSFSVVTSYDMAANGTITAGATSVNLSLNSGTNYGNGSSQACAADPAPLGCVSNPFVIAATLNVAVGTPNGTTGVLTVSHTGSQGATADATPAQGHVIVVVASAYELDGFYQPVDNAVVNGAKAGRVIPLKFNILDADGVKQSDTGLVEMFVMKTTCNGGDTHDLLTEETLASGKTELRWDSDGEQMVFNWKTPKSPGCYRIVLKVDGDSIKVDFQLS